MYGSDFCSFSFWWLIPLMMIILCFFMMRSRRGSMMCGVGFPGNGRQQTGKMASAIDILDKRYAAGEINKDEYEDKKRDLENRKD